MMYLPRLCEHCLNPACVAACPSGAIYKREEDGIVLIDQDKCRGWRMCVSGCPYKKIYYNWSSGKSEKCIFCYPRIEAGQPTVCSETCVGRIRYLGVMLYDADGIEEAASVAGRAGSLRGAARHLPRSATIRAVIAQARARRRAGRLAGGRASVAGLEDGDGVEGRLPAASRIPHPADGLVRAAAVADPVGGRGRQDRASTATCRTCARCASRCKYLANLLTAGDEEPVGAGPGAHARDARLHAGQDHRRRDRRDASPRRSGSPGSRSRTCTRSWRSPTTRIASSSRPRIARSARMPTTCAAPAASRSATAARAATPRRNLFGAHQAQGQDARWRS